MSSERLAYADPDTSAVMARDASACRAEAHLARVLDATARRSADPAPATPGTRDTHTVTESTARFAARLFE
jgi:hypothetical protein